MELFGKKKGKKSPVTRGLSDYHEAPLHIENSSQREVNFFSGGNENMEGEQEIDEVEVGTSSNGVVSPIFGNNVSEIDIKIGNNINGGRNQKINKVKFGNVE